jgi:glucokinase
VTFAYPILIGDIGGTNARFALLPAPGAPMHVLPRVLTASFPRPEDAIRDVLQGGPRPRSAVLAVAARVEGPVVEMTNAHWTVNAAEIAAALALDRVSLVNDYVPVAAALSALREEPDGDLARIGPAIEGEPGTKVVLGPGTGLGAAALVPVRNRLMVLPTEAGHVEFGPAEAGEAAFWGEIEQVYDRVTAEAVLSGPGLVRLHRALVRAGGGADELDMPSDVCDAGLSGSDLHAVATLDLFSRLLGRFAGDLAMIFGARGGVYIASGIAPRILGVLRSGAFRAAFELKAPQDDFMRKVPTWVVMHPDPALRGLMVLAEQDESFIYPCATHVSGLMS